MPPLGTDGMLMRVGADRSHAMRTLSGRYHAIYYIFRCVCRSQEYIESS